MLWVMRVYARWPSHHARTSVVERSDRSRHAANEAPEDPEEEAPIPGVFVFEEEPDAANEGEGVALSFLSSGYWRSIWNERASRRERRISILPPRVLRQSRKNDEQKRRLAERFFQS